MGLKNISDFREFYKDHAQCDLLFKSSQISKRPFVNLGIGTSALELELELELILQTPLFPVPLGLWTPNLAGW